MAAKGKEHMIVDYLFPTRLPIDWSVAPSPVVHDLFSTFNMTEGDLSIYPHEEIPFFIEAEMATAVQRLSRGKRPGLLVYQTKLSKPTHSDCQNKS